MGISRSYDLRANTSSTVSRLVKDAKRGNRAAFDDLVALELSELRRFVASKVAQPEVDDLIQDVLLSAWKSIHSFDGRSKFRTWVFGICLHKIKDHYRSQTRRINAISLDANLDAVIDGVGDHAVLAGAVKSYLKQLSDSQAEVIELYYQQQLTLAEVSHVLDRNLNTVKYQFCQAHLKLSKSMRDGGFL